MSLMNIDWWPVRFLTSTKGVYKNELSFID